MLAYVTSTHWDREWYQPFQHYRMRLVELVDRWLADVDAGRIQGPFQTDGQWIPIEDYLEIRPHQKSRIGELLAAGKILSGPWYVQPDEFLPSGESLLRNLEEGCRSVREAGGEPSKAGLIADQFGHISQLPQVFAGFGIRGVFLWRGLPADVPAWFWWKGVDGTILPAHAFPGLGYVAFAALVRSGMDPSREAIVPEDATRQLKKYIQNEIERSPISPVLLFDGADHFQIDPEVWALVKDFAEQNHMDARHVSLDELLDAALSESQKIQTVIEGELRETGRETDRLKQDAWLIPGIASSRMDLKLRNADCEMLLCRWVEPFCALAGEKIPGTKDFLRAAWRHLLQNHAHDSIGGCSVDQVHRDMQYRFDQSRLIAEGLLARVLPALAGGECGPPNPEGFEFVIFNPASKPSSEPTEATLRFPPDWPTFAEWFVPPDRLPGFRIIDPEGNEVTYWRLDQRQNQAWMQPMRQNFPQSGKATEVDIVMRPQLPALGFTRYRVVPADAGNDLHHAEPTRHPSIPSMRTGLHAMENDFVRVEVSPNGTLTLTDKRTGSIYPGLLTLEDGGDFGDGWFFAKPQQDEICSSWGANAQISILEDNPLRCAFGIRFLMNVPLGRSLGTSNRGAATRTIHLEWTVRLRADSPRIDLELSMVNSAFDHRLRVLFPTGARAAKTFLTDSAFDVIDRNIALPADNHTYREPRVETVPLQSWVACHAEGSGLAVVAHGLREAAVIDRPDRAIALTLLRAVGRTFLTNGEPDGQSHGELNYRMSILPLEGPPNRAEMFQEAARLAAGTRSLQLSGLLTPDAPASASAFSVEGEAVLSALRSTEAGVEVRLFNPSDVPVESRLIFSDSSTCPASLVPVDFTNASTNEPELVVQSALVSIGFKPKQIRSFLFSYQPDHESE